MQNYLIETKLYQMIGQFNERKITPKVFYSIIPSKIHPFYDGNEKTSQVLFANDAEIMKLIDETEVLKYRKVKKVKEMEKLIRKN